MMGFQNWERSKTATFILVYIPRTEATTWAKEMPENSSREVFFSINIWVDVKTSLT